MSTTEFPRFYFALPRLLATFRGGSSERAENNGGEAWIGSIATYVVSYLFFAQLIPVTLGVGPKILSLVLLAFLVWLFWLLALYLNKREVYPGDGVSLNFKQQRLDVPALSNSTAATRRVWTSGGLLFGNRGRGDSPEQFVGEGLGHKRRGVDTLRR